MFSQITVHFRKELNVPRLFAGVSKRGALADALCRTVFAETPEVATNVIHWDLTTTCTTLVFAQGTHALEIHVENHMDGGSIAKLKGSSEECCRIIEDAAANLSLKIDEVTINVHAEKNLISRAKRISLLDHLKKQFAEKLLSGFLVSLFVAGAVYYGSLQSDASIASFCATIVALIGRTLIEALTFKGEFAYADA